MCVTTHASSRLSVCRQMCMCWYTADIRVYAIVANLGHVLADVSADGDQFLPLSLSSLYLLLLLHLTCLCHVANGRLYSFI